MEIKINNESWKIIEKTYDDVTCAGNCDYNNQIIELSTNQTKSMKKRTLIHELTHLFMWEYGHNQQDRSFTHEDVCEIMSAFSEKILEITNNYIEKTEKI